MTAPSGPVERLVEVVLFAPLGLALKARDELPKLAAYGRERFTTQARVARMVGQMTVTQARRQIEGVLARRPSGPEPAPAPVPAPPPAGRPVAVRDLGPDDPLPVPAPETVPEPVGEDPATPPPLAVDLPIPGYDSLSASQVVQRLPGLSRDELDAVRAYEQAGRNRQTILLRVAQLRAAS